MIRHFFVAAVLGATLLSVYGCGGLSSTEAKERCDAERTGRADCFDSKAFSSCISCFEDCGDDCVPTASCPVRYICPDDGNATGQQPE